MSYQVSCDISEFTLFLLLEFIYITRLSPRYCTCSNALGVSVDPTIITIQKTRHSIRISQATDASVSRQDFEYLLRSVQFAHDPERPPVDRYSVLISVTADDGSFISEIAFNRIEILVFNIGPIVLFGGLTDVTMMMADGEVEVPLLPSGTVVSLFEDTTTIQNVSITLTNPRESDEVYISPVNLPSTITVTSDGVKIVLRGPASPADFSQFLTDASIYYRYPPMESILRGDIPEFTTR